MKHAPPRAVQKYEEFHQKPPRKIGDFGHAFKIPSRVARQGKALYVLYRSDKRDPETGALPKKPIDYIHEHETDGVTLYLTAGAADTDVPASIVTTSALVLLGQCLGFGFEKDGNKQEGRSTRPYPELYTTPDGHALVVVQSRKDVIAIVWGGGLGVTKRGIVG